MLFKKRERMNDMKKRFAAAILMVAILVTLIPANASADFNITSPSSTYEWVNVGGVTLIGKSGRIYSVEFTSDFVALHHPNASEDAVMVCQAYINAVFDTYYRKTGIYISKIAVDGIFYTASDTALRRAQEICGVTVDGDCHLGTWRAMYN